MNVICRLYHRRLQNTLHVHPKLSSIEIQSRSLSIMSSVQQKADAEKLIQRNPHGDFKSVESERPDFADVSWTFTKTKDPNWKPGQGATDGGSLPKKHREIDPYEEGRPAVFNYKLLISGIVPRFIGFISTRSKDGKSSNLAPFSYTTVVNHDPPVFVVGFSGGFDKAKDTLRNLKETSECTINVISEEFIEAANFCSINTPYGVSEWTTSGLTPAKCSTVSASRVLEAGFSIEGKLMETKEFESRTTPGKKTGVLAIIEGTRFWAREDVINDDGNLLDPKKLRPVSRLGGITYGRTVSGFEIPRPDYDTLKNNGELEGIEKAKYDEQ